MASPTSTSTKTARATDRTTRWEVGEPGDRSLVPNMVAGRTTVNIRPATGVIHGR